MYRLLIAFVLASTVPSITACGPTIPVASASSGAAALEVSLKKAYYVALSGAVGLERAAELAVDMGLLKPGSPTAISVADKLNSLKAAMDEADRAFKAADAVQLSAQITRINYTVGSIKGLLGIK